jgi:hypothetical protein
MLEGDPLDTLTKSNDHPKLVTLISLRNVSLYEVATGNDLELHSIDSMKYYTLYTEIPRRQEPYIKPWMTSSRTKGSTPSDLRNLCFLFQEGNTHTFHRY